mmetsp:Transcript_7872/g.19535  ORF Transcript_7872/g.19535 Transcript_7872/m.19535 type:complete len:606 (-) Transcript_7872:126-1943(-)
MVTPTRPSSSPSRMKSVAIRAVRLAFGLSIACAIIFIWETQPQVLESVFASNNLELIEIQESKLRDLTQKVDQLISNEPSFKASLQTLGKRQRDDHETAKVLEKALRDFYDYSQSRFKTTEDSIVGLGHALHDSSESRFGDMEDKISVFTEMRDSHNSLRSKFKNIEDDLAGLALQIANLDVGTVAKSDAVDTPRRLKVHFWDDSTHKAPREDLLVAEGWTEYNGMELGHEKDSSTPPWFVKTDDPEEADLIIWVSVMAIHQQEIPPDDPAKHLHKVIVLDHADGCTIHKKLDHIREKQTEIAYFKRSFVHRGKWNSYRGNCTSGRNVRPYSYCGAKVMMIPMDSEGADVNFEVKRPDDGKVYGQVFVTKSDNKQPEDGYFKDDRYQNFLVPFQDRKWTVTNVLRHREDSPNQSRNRIVEWTHEFSTELVGEPREEKQWREGGKDAAENNDGYSAFVGEVDNFCIGYCFGMNYLRHLRDAKIVVTCNPSNWEGDFRMWEAFMSGAMVMVDETATLGFMPNPPQNGVHFITYDPAKKEDFMGKLRHYTDPANKAETEKIAKAGYEFVLRNHMAVNRVGYVLDQVRDQLIEHVEDPSARALLRLPPK